MLKKTTLNAKITIPAILIILGLSLISAIYPIKTVQVLDSIKQLIFKDMSWFFIFSVSLFFIFLVCLCCSKYGNIKLGRDDSKPEYSFFSWVSMLFAAGMGIGLLYFGVSEPMAHFNEPVIHAKGIYNAMKEAQVLAFFHWGIHGWTIYCIVGLALAYFSYRYKLPLSLRSPFYPIFKKKIFGTWGNLIDIFALCGTFFGLSTSLGYGVVQISAGFEHVGLIKEATSQMQVIIVLIVMSIAIFSAISGVSKGVKILSNINIIFACLLLIFIILVGPTVFILGAFSDGIGNYLSSIMSLTFNTRTYEPGYTTWFNNWTVFYWAWWISWSPYVGLFIARISKGRTIREFILGVLLVPTLFVTLWMTVFGSTAIYLDIHNLHGALSSLINRPEILLFKFLDSLPLSSITSVLSIIILCIFFITSADSGIFVMNSISTRDKKNSPSWQKVMWGMLLAILSLSLLKLGGLGSLQTVTIISALPFTVIILIYIVSLIRGLSMDHSYYDTSFTHSTINWGGKRWKEKLKDVLNFNERKDVKTFMMDVVEPAFIELKAEFAKQNIDATIRYGKNKYKKIEFSIHHDNLKNFSYAVVVKIKDISDMFIEDDNTPDFSEENYYSLDTYFADGRLGYDVQYFSKDELLSDVLKQYERFLTFASDSNNDLFLMDTKNK